MGPSRGKQPMLPCHGMVSMVGIPKLLTGSLLIQPIKGPCDARGTVQVLLRFWDLTRLARGAVEDWEMI